MNLSREKIGMAPRLKERKFSLGIPYPLGAFADRRFFELAPFSLRKIHYIFTFL